VPTIKVRVEGNVQGVGFRAFVMRLAREYHLRGEVWNSFDGSVIAIFQSENAGNLERAVQKISTGPGEVEKVASSPADDSDFEGFSITRSR
jgi:acylphosphatase